MYHMKVNFIAPVYSAPLTYLANIMRGCHARKDDMLLHNLQKPTDKDRVLLIQKSENDVSSVNAAMLSEHHTVFEHIMVTWDIQGISRALLAQLTRHRLTSPTVESQRYVKYDRDSDIWAEYIDPNMDYIKNKKTRESILEKIDECMGKVRDTYSDLIKAGLRPEDARGILTQNFPTNLTISMNLREFLFVVYPLRHSSHAQKEIKELVENMMASLIAAYSASNNDTKSSGKFNDFVLFLQKDYKTWLAAQNHPSWK